MDSKEEYEVAIYDEAGGLVGSVTIAACCAAKAAEDVVDTNQHMLSGGSVYGVAVAKHNPFTDNPVFNFVVEMP